MISGEDSKAGTGGESPLPETRPTRVEGTVRVLTRYQTPEDQSELTDPLEPVMDVRTTKTK